MIIKAAQVTEELNEQAKEMRKASAPGENGVRTMTSLPPTTLWRPTTARCRS